MKTQPTCARSSSTMTAASSPSTSRPVCPCRRAMWTIRTLDRLLAAFARSNGKRPRLVHRLDAQTSGVIVAGKTQPAAAAMSEAFAERLVTKTYLAIVTGSPMPPGETEFSMALSRHIARPGLELMRAARPGDQSEPVGRHALAGAGVDRFHPPALRRAADGADAPDQGSPVDRGAAHPGRSLLWRRGHPERRAGAAPDAPCGEAGPPAPHRGRPDRA